MEGMAFYPAREQAKVVNTTTTAKDASFGFYAAPSKRVSTTAAAVKPQPKVSNSTSSQEAAKENHLSLYAAGSLAMGFFLNTGRSLARA